MVELEWGGRRVVTPECEHDLVYNDGRLEAYCPHDRILYIHTPSEHVKE